MLLAELFLSIHLLVVFFIVSGLILIPVGASLRWPFAASLWYRAVHLGAIAIVALQKFFGKLCFLSVWEFDTLQESSHRESDMQPILAFGDRLIHWNLPLWFFTVLYALTWAYVIGYGGASHLAWVGAHGAACPGRLLPNKYAQRSFQIVKTFGFCASA